MNGESGKSKKYTLTFNAPGASKQEVSSLQVDANITVTIT